MTPLIQYASAHPATKELFAILGNTLSVSFRLQNLIWLRDAAKPMQTLITMCTQFKAMTRVISMISQKT